MTFGKLDGKHIKRYIDNVYNEDMILKHNPRVRIIEIVGVDPTG